MAKRFIDTDLFKKRFIRDLPPAYKLLWVYLFCECDNAGIWEVDLEVAGLYCGETYDLEDFEKAFAGRIHFFNNGSKAFLPGSEAHFAAAIPSGGAAHPNSRWI